MGSPIQHPGILYDCNIRRSGKPACPSVRYTIPIPHLYHSTLFYCDPVNDILLLVHNHDIDLHSSRRLFHTAASSIICEGMYSRGVVDTSRSSYSARNVGGLVSTHFYMNYALTLLQIGLACTRLNRSRAITLWREAFCMRSEGGRST
jgi:hypothetical protein